jgi:transposase-like protein
MKQAKEMSVMRRRKTMSKKEIFSALEQFDSAGNISIKEFAAAFQISEATYYNWRKKYQNNNALPTGGFMEVDLSGLRKEEVRGEIFAEFKGIIFYQKVDPAYLKALL